MSIGIVCGASGAMLTTHHVLVLGFSGLAALSIGLGLNELLSFRAQNLFLLHEHAAARARLRNTRPQVLAEVAGCLEAQGVLRGDAEAVVRTLGRYEAAFVEGLYLPQACQTLMPASPAELTKWAPLVTEAFSTFLAVLIVGALPLLGSVLVFAGDPAREGAAFATFYALAAAALFTLGALKSCFYGVAWYVAGGQTFVVGLACGAAGFAAGVLTQRPLEGAPS